VPFVLRKRKPAYKPGSVVNSHSSGMHVTVHLERPTREQRGPRQCSPIWSCSGWGLPCHGCYQLRGALLPHHFTLTGAKRWRYIFCGTFRRLTPPRRYLAPCPVEPGLSSMTAVTAAVRPASACNYRENCCFTQSKYRILLFSRICQPGIPRQAETSDYFLSWQII